MNDAPQAGAPVVIKYAPRPLQVKFHRDAKRWSVAICHRRFGKTVMAINELIKRLLTCEHRNPTGVYICPTFSQAERVAWEYVKEFTEPLPGVKYNSAKLRCEFEIEGRGKATIYLLSGSNDAGEQIRGMALDYAIFDEYADLPPKLFPTIVRPALADRGGGALWIGTPKGFSNPLYEVYEQAQAYISDGNPDWHVCLFKASETGVLSEEELDELRGQLSHNQYQQELECDWGAAIQGAYYAEILARIETQGQIGKVPHDPNLLVNSAWDLGVRDMTSVWLYQEDRAGNIRVIKSFQASGEGLGYYANMLQQWGMENSYTYGDHLFPHDVDSRNLDIEARKRSDILRQLGVFPRVVPLRKVTEGIEAVRVILERCHFDAEECADGLAALRHYRVRETSGMPLHDENSHYADAFRYLAIGHREYVNDGFNRRDWTRPIEYGQTGVI